MCPTEAEGGGYSMGKKKSDREHQTWLPGDGRWVLRLALRLKTLRPLVDYSESKRNDAKINQIRRGQMVNNKIGNGDGCKKIF